MLRVNRWIRLGATGAATSPRRFGFAAATSLSRFGFAAAVFSVLAAPALGGGFSIFEQGSQATAMGGAFVAQAYDGSAMFYNPAGIANQPGVNAMLGDTLIFFDAKLEHGLNPYPGEDYSAKQIKQIFFPPHFYASAPIAKNVNLAIGAWSPFGLSTAWEDPENFRGRFLSQRVDLRMFALGAQVSVKLSDWLSVGGGPELRFSDVKLQRNVPIFNPFTRRVVDAAHVDIKSDSIETNVSWGAGILLTPCPRIRVGASFHAHVDVIYEGKAIFYQLPTGSAQLDGAFASRIPVNTDVPVRTTVQYPSTTMFGVSGDVTDRLTLEADGTYWSWNAFDQTTLRFEPVNGKQAPNSTLVHNWESTWAIRAGVRFKASDALSVMAGYVYDQTPQPDEDVSPLLPDANRTGISAGFAFNFGRSTLSLSNLVLFFHDRTTTTNVDNFSGQYKTFADLVVLNFRTSF